MWSSRLTSDGDASGSYTQSSSRSHHSEKRSRERDALHRVLAAARRLLEDGERAVDRRLPAKVDRVGVERVHVAKDHRRQRVRAARDARELVDDDRRLRLALEAARAVRRVRQQVDAREQDGPGGPRARAGA